MKMKKILKALFGFNAVIQMANEAVDFKKMIYDLLGLPATADDSMVNERFKKAMSVSADDTSKKMVAKCNELEAANATLKTQLSDAEKAKTGFEVKITELTTAKTSADGLFANERQARIKLIVNQAVLDGRLTGADVEPTIQILANAKDFDAEVSSLDKKEKKIPAQKSAGLGNEVKGLNEPSAASKKFTNLVNERKQKFPGEGHLGSWKAVEATDEGKALMAQMKQPEHLKK
jgi:hypothetical protein